MEIDIPFYSKLPEKDLKQRLKKALNASQCYSSTIPKGVLYPSRLSKWPDEKPIHQAIVRLNSAEAARNRLAMMLGRDSTEMHKNAFADMRYSINTLVDNWDKGGRGCCLFEDLQETMAILVRVSGALAHRRTARRT